MIEDILDGLRFLFILITTIALIILPLVGLSYLLYGHVCHAKWDGTAKAEYGLFSGCLVNGIPEEAYISKYLQVTIKKD